VDCLELENSKIILNMQIYAGYTLVFALNNKMESTRNENQTDIKQDDGTRLSKQDDEVILHL
jgi:hypothetical protein